MNDLKEINTENVCVHCVQSQLLAALCSSRRTLPSSGDSETLQVKYFYSFSAELKELQIHTFKTFKKRQMFIHYVIPTFLENVASVLNSK